MMDLGDDSRVWENLKCEWIICETKIQLCVGNCVKQMLCHHLQAFCDSSLLLFLFSFFPSLLSWWSQTLSWTLLSDQLASGWGLHPEDSHGVKESFAFLDSLFSLTMSMAETMSDTLALIVETYWLTASIKYFMLQPPSLALIKASLTLLQSLWRLKNHWLCLGHLVQQVLSHRLLLHFHWYAVSVIVALHVN